jgi:1-pyrroline-5-carboxylate dehydrogenase
MFENENTFIRLQKVGKEKEFDSSYERGLKEAESYLAKEYPNLIAGDVLEEKKIEDISPIDGKKIATFQLSSKESVEKALDISYQNYRSWYNKGYLERSRILLRAYDLIREKKYLIAAIEAYENGKNRYEAVADVDEALDFIRYYALNLIENEGFIRFTGKGYDNEESMSVMKPYGVFAVIPPFNFYAITVGMTVGPLITGNAVILKPSSDIPIISYLTVKLMHEAGVPKEVLVFLSGSGGIVGRALAEHPKVGGIVFTGSRDVGMDIYHHATEKAPKPVITEMGGKDANIVTAKANLQKAVEGVVRAAFGFAGQKCSACSLLFVQDSIYDLFLEKLKDRTSKIVVGDPRKKEAFLNPVVNKAAFDKFRSLQDTFAKEGKILTGGRTLDRNGFYVEPTIIYDLKADASIVKNEIFLPVLAVRKFKTLEEAVAEINSSEYGLTGGIFTEDPEEIRYYFDNVDVGVIYANRERGGSTGAMVGSQPFVGWKMSGSTGKGTGSFYYLTQFLREQAQTIAH